MRKLHEWKTGRMATDPDSVTNYLFANAPFVALVTYEGGRVELVRIDTLEEASELKTNAMTGMSEIFEVVVFARLG